MATKTGARAWVVLVVTTWVTAFVACTDATQIVLHLHSQVPYREGRDVTLQFASTPEATEAAAAAAVVTDAWQGEDIGTLTAVPRKGASTDAPFEVRAVMGVERPAEDCVRDGTANGCIIVRRQLSFLPRKTLNLRIDFYDKCVGVPCDEHTSCVASGLCESAAVDPQTCLSDEGCDVPGAATPAEPDAESQADAESNADGRAVGAGDADSPDAASDASAPADADGGRGDAAGAGGDAAGNGGDAGDGGSFAGVDCTPLHGQLHCDPGDYCFVSPNGVDVRCDLANSPNFIDDVSECDGPEDCTDLMLPDCVNGTGANASCQATSTTGPRRCHTAADCPHAAAGCFPTGDPQGYKHCF